MSDIIQCDNLDESIEHYTKRLGYRLNMIKPADAPREALLSVPPAVAGGLTSVGESVKSESEQIRLVLKISDSHLQPHATVGGPDTGDWIQGRAGMEYRDLIPGRLGGKVIASHIRLTKGGEVPDYVHYHKVDFQMIYCKAGRIKVVYEDQGPPFWLETGDCVLQPPEIRHRVLECTAGAEVIEVSMPAEHETWVEHDILLPSAMVKPDRYFGGQRFFRYSAGDIRRTHSSVAENLPSEEECCRKLAELILRVEECSHTSDKKSAYYQQCCQSFVQYFLLNRES